MPTRHLISRYTCSAGNAFNPGAALLAALLPPPKRHVSYRPLEIAPRDREQSFIETQQPPQQSVHQQDVLEEPRPQQVKEDGWWKKQSLSRPKEPLQDSAPLRKVIPASQLRLLRHYKHGAAKASEEDEEDMYHQRKLVNQKPFFRLDVNQIQPNTDTEKRQPSTLRSDAVEDNISTRGGRGRQPNRNTVGIRDSKSEFFVDVLRTGYTKSTWKMLQHEVSKRALEYSKQRISPNDTATIEAGRRIMDYAALYIDTPKSPAAEPQLPPWRLSTTEMAGMEAIDVLNLEIEKFARFMDLTPMEVAARSSVSEEVAELIRTTAGNNVGIETFGSSEVGLATILSDIDMRLYFHYSRKPYPPSNMIVKMEGIEYALKNFHPDFMLVSLRCARYPIINTQHKQTGLDIQIVSAPDTKAQRQAMAKYLEDIPHLRSVYMVLRMALGIRGLVDVFNGGIGSYGLFMMLVASLQRPSSKPPTTAGECLLRFLDFYCELNTEKYGVSISPPKLFKKHDLPANPTKARVNAARLRGDNIRAAQWAIGQTRRYQPYLFCLQDPADPFNDLGRKSNAIKHIQKTLRVLRASLQQSLQLKAPTALRKPPWKEQSILLPLVGRCHEIYQDRRSRAEMQGRAAMQLAKAKADRAAVAETEAGVPTEAVGDLGPVEQKAAV